MTINYRDPRRRTLPFEDWPEADKALWRRARQPGSILEDDAGPWADWSAGTERTRRRGYGRWLGFLCRRGLLGRNALPHERITPDTVRAYIEDLEALDVSPTSRVTYMVTLLVVAEAFAPGGDWGWLRGIVRKLDRRKRPVRDKFRRLRPAHEIAAWAYARMREIERQEAPGRRALVDYRNALCVALLISCPMMRLRNLAMIEIGVHLQKTHGTWRVTFDAGETKTGRVMTCDLPERLAPWLERYLEHYRPQLLGESISARLWISRRGQPIGTNRLAECVGATTRAAFGVTIRPHLFRDCAATSVAVENPERVGTAPAILGHAGPATTERHYMHANGIAANRRYRESVDRLRHDLPARITTRMREESSS